MNSADNAALEAILDSRPPEPRWLLPLLQDIQARFRHLPESALVALSDKLGIPLAKVFAVAKFYKAFSMVPKAEKVFSVCQGTACHLRGAPQLVKALEEALGVEMGAQGGKNGLESVNCLGACAMAPVVTVEGEVHGRLDPAGAKALAGGQSGKEARP
jgi:NADH-quinone oxidoreductase subunit E